MLWARLSQRAGQSFLNPEGIRLATLLARRFSSSQDCIFGLANKSNLIKTFETQTACGPSFFMLLAQMDIDSPYKFDALNVRKNESLAEIVGLYRPNRMAHSYSDFPKQIHHNVQRRNGMLILSFLHDGQPWDPEPLMNYLVENTVQTLEKLPSMDLFNSYLNRRELTTKQLEELALAEPVPPMMTQDEYVTRYCRQVMSADPNLLSFTDVEFGYLFFGCEDAELYNVAVILPDGSLFRTLDFKRKLEGLLKAKKSKGEKGYGLLLKEFRNLTRGAKARSAKFPPLEEGLRKIPAFEPILRSENEFFRNNFKSLCLKIEAYLLNQVRKGEALLVNLQFPMVHKGTPHIMSLMFRKDEEVGIIVEEVLGGMDNRFSIHAEKLYPPIEHSLTYCGSPSASMCIVENPTDVIEITERVMGARPTVALNPAVQIFSDLYEVFSNEVVRLRCVDRQRLSFSKPEKIWISRLGAMVHTGFIFADFKLDGNGPDQIDEGSGIFTDGGEYIEPDQTPDPRSVANYIWTFFQDRELVPGKDGLRDFGALPKGIAKPEKYPHHIGAASPDNPLKPTISKMTDRDFSAVKELQLE